MILLKTNPVLVTLSNLITIIYGYNRKVKNFNNIPTKEPSSNFPRKGRTNYNIVQRPLYNIVRSYTTV